MNWACRIELAQLAAGGKPSRQRIRAGDRCHDEFCMVSLTARLAVACAERAQYL